MTVGCLYIIFFKESLVNGEWISTNGYARIIIPDTLLYSDIVDDNNIIESITLSGVKNTFVPSFLWIISGFDWFNMLFINIGFVYLITYYMERLANQYDIPWRKAQLAIVIFLALPTNIYYSIGALKELPMAALLLASLYYFNLRRFKLALLMVVLLIMVRYQIAIVIFLLFISSISNKTMRASFIILLLLSAIYPLLNSLDILSQDATQSFRMDWGVANSIGSKIENIRNNYFLLSTFAVIVRCFQSLFEPIIGFFQSFTFYEYKDLSISLITHIPSNIIMLPYIYLFFKKLVYIVYIDKIIIDKVQTIYALLLILIVLIGGFSFIHNRYLIPVYPLMIIASLIPYKRM